jgi:hypothetical protein
MNVTEEMISAAITAYHDEYHAEYPEIRHDMRQAIEAAMQAAWVSVDDALPKPFHDVLVYRPRTTTAGIPTYDVSNHNGERFYGNSYPPSHWMTIPAYKGE